MNYSIITNAADTAYHEKYSGLLLESGALWGGHTDFIENENHLLISSEPEACYRGNGMIIIGHGSYFSSTGKEALQNCSSRLIGKNSSRKLFVNKTSISAVAIVGDKFYMVNTMKEEETYIIRTASCEIITNDVRTVQMFYSQMESHVTVGVSVLNRRSVTVLNEGASEILKKR